MKYRILLTLLVGALVAGAVAQTKPATRGGEDTAAIRKLAADLNAAVVAGEARGIRRLMYVPESDYDFGGMQRYLEAVARGEFKDWRFEVLHAEVEGDYAAVIISQQPPGGATGEVTPVAMFKPGVRWRILPFDLRKDHPEIGGETAATAYEALLERAGKWVRANTNAKDDGNGSTRPAD